jgi:hypothetical protein
MTPATPADKPRQLSLKIDEQNTCGIVYMPCRLLGLCAGVIDKPLLCKLYPFLPVGHGAESGSTVPASVFDATFQAMGWQTPCTVHRAGHPYDTQVIEEAARERSLGKPYVQFYLRLAGALHDIYVKKLMANSNLTAKTGPEFWRAWEFAYLSGALVDRARLRDSALAILAELKAEFPGFELGHDVVQV